MSKYKKGDQFWFEITDVIDASNGKTMYLCSNGGYAADGMLDGYNRLDPDEEANADFDAGYAEGLNDAWEAVRKIREYEEKQKAESEIKVGDEVIERLEKSTITFVVFGVLKDRVYGFTKDGSWNACYKENARKTGRHFSEIENVLKAMREADDADN